MVNCVRTCAISRFAKTARPGAWALWQSELGSKKLCRAIFDFFFVGDHVIACVKSCITVVFEKDKRISEHKTALRRCLRVSRANSFCMSEKNGPGAPADSAGCSSCDELSSWGEFSCVFVALGKGSVYMRV